MIDELENKYADLLVNRCLDLSKSNSIFIHYFNDNKSLIDKVISLVKEKGIDDIYLNELDKKERHKHLSQSLKDIENDSYFDNHFWDEYAKKNAAFLMISTEFPHYFDDISEENMAMAGKKARNSRPVFREKQAINAISWCIAVMPNMVWAKNSFPNLSDEEAYEKLFNLMMSATMVDTKNPIDEWNKFLEKQKKLVKKLNNLEITSMHYTNKLGTDLFVGLPQKVIWQCAGYGDNSIVNMPTYEVFTSPDYRYTSGIVYASKPLMYGGVLIDKFWLKFKDGQVVDYDAKVGKEILKVIIESDKYSCFLGECALVSKNSGVAKTNFVFGETCLDENASCHIALGDAFPECIECGLEENRESLRTKGLNHSTNHVDLMIGTSDLNITAMTKKGEKLIFKDGDFNI